MPSENVVPSTPDRRTRKRDARRQHLLDLAAELVEQVGVDGLTMAALADAADYAPASLYTYFGSRGALLAALQRRALATLGDVADAHLAAWDRALGRLGAGERSSEPTRALARLWAFSDLFLSAPDHHPREFRLQQQLLVTAGSTDAADAATVVPAAMHVLDAPRRLLAAAVATGALAPHRPVHDPLDHEVDGSLVRTFSWVVALNGALLTDRLPTGMPLTATALGDELTRALLAGWGADPAALDDARSLARSLEVR